MALVLKDRVKETTTTTGTGTYTLAGAVTGFEAFSEIGDGNTTYYACTDGTDFEVGIGTYTASGTTLARTTILQSSNSDNAVSWTSGTRTIFCTQPADKAVFLDENEDLQVKGGSELRLTSSSGNPVVRIGGGGPNGIRFIDGSNLGDNTNAVDIKYRTGPNDLLIETAGNNKIAEFGGDDGHAALYYNNNYRLETTSTGVTIHSADGNASPMPDLSLYRNSTTPADNDDLGEITFDGNNDATTPEKVEYARIDTRAVDVTDGSEDGQLDIAVTRNGTSTVYQRMSYGQAQFYQNIYLGTGLSIAFEGDNYNSNEISLTAADPTADRTITLPDATGEVVLSDGNIDTDASAEIGRAHVGYVGHTDYAGFSHVDHNTSTNYSILHSAAGNTFINGVGSINMRIGNASNTATVTSSGIILGASKSLLFEGSTDDANETTIVARDPTSDNTIYIPDNGGTFRVVEHLTLTANLAVGWRTIAVLEGRDSRGVSNQRLTAKFTVADTSSGRHNLVTFTAQHAFGADNGLQVYGYSTYGTDTITNIRIKSSTLYGGAAIQIYVANATNNITVFLDENNLQNAAFDLGSIILKDGIADATDPGNVGYTAGSDEYSGFTEKARINLARIEHGGFATSNRLLVQDVEDGAGTGPFIDLYRQSESPADGDNLGTVRFVGHNDAGESLNYAEIRADAADVSDGTEDGKIFLYVKDGGSDRLVTEFTSYGVQFHENVNIQSNKQLRFEGATADDFETAVIPTDPTADRTITLPDKTGTVAMTSDISEEATALAIALG